jgi:hypothetical protein
LVIFTLMKRAIFSILLIWGLILAIIQVEGFDAPLNELQQLLSNKNNQDLAPALKNTGEQDELLCHQNPPVCHGASRIQNLAGLLFPGVLHVSYLSSQVGETSINHTTPSFKNYLLYIYPTHNFW